MIDALCEPICAVMLTEKVIRYYYESSVDHYIELLELTNKQGHTILFILP